MEDEEGHKYLASYMIDAWRARGGHAAVPAKVRRESFCDSPEIIFTHGERQFSFFFGKTPFNDPQADTLISDKWLLFQTLGDQIPLPYTEFVAKDDPRDDAALVQAILQKAEDPHSPLAFPLVVKPSEGSLSRNVFIAHEAHELARAIRANRDDPDNGPGILLQRYLGDEEGLFREIRGICLDGRTMIAYERTTTQPIPDNVLTDPAHWPGVVRREVTDPAIIEQIDSIADRLHEDYGVCYVAFDMKCDRDGKMWVLEGNVAPLGLDEIERQMPNGGALIHAMAEKMLDKVMAHAPQLQYHQDYDSQGAAGPPEPDFS
ncbi:MAG: hypothetical protein KJ017_12260 [Alphaproteobacteria bacterium]|nr:hypothetical protein [Alphaproteobacteria bacterium]